MAASEPSAFQKKLSLLRSRYLIHLSERVKDLDVYLQIKRAGSVSQKEKDEIAAIVHQLAGSGGTYGFQEISDRAATVEAQIKTEMSLTHEALAEEVLALCAVCKNAAEEDGLPDADKEEGELLLADEALPLVAVVDDDPMIRLALKTLLSSIARVVTGKNTHEAVDLMRKYKPSLLLLDDIMPGGITGLSFLEARREDPTLSSIPIIMVTASNQKEDVVRGITAGAVDYIIKPIVPEKLMAAVRQILFQRPNSIVLRLQDGALEAALSVRLRKLGCDVYGALTEWADIQEQIKGDPTIIVFDGFSLPPAEAASLMAQYPQSALLQLLDAEEAPPSSVTLAKSESMANTADEEDIVRRIGLILSRKRNLADQEKSAFRQEGSDD